MFSQNARRRVVDVPIIAIWELVYIMQAYLEIVVSEIQLSVSYLSVILCSMMVTITLE